MTTLSQTQFAMNTNAMRNSLSTNFEGLLQDIDAALFEEIAYSDEQAFEMLFEVQENIYDTNYKTAAQVARNIGRGGLADMLDELQEELEAELKGGAVVDTTASGEAMVAHMNSEQPQEDQYENLAKSVTLLEENGELLGVWCMAGKLRERDARNTRPSVDFIEATIITVEAIQDEPLYVGRDIQEILNRTLKSDFREAARIAQKVGKIHLAELLKDLERLYQIDIAAQ